MTSNAVGITLQYALELPSAARRGLGLRRVSCVAHSDDKPSRVVARRVGLKEGGTLWWEFVLHEGAEGHGIPVRAGDPESVFIRRAREHVQGLTDRK